MSNFLTSLLGIGAQGLQGYRQGQQLADQRADRQRKLDLEKERIDSEARSSSIRDALGQAQLHELTNPTPEWQQFGTPTKYLDYLKQKHAATTTAPQRKTREVTTANGIISVDDATGQPITGADGKPTVIGQAYHPIDPNSDTVLTRKARDKQTLAEFVAAHRPQPAEDRKFDLVANGVLDAASQYQQSGGSSPTEMLAIKDLLQDPKSVRATAEGLIVNTALPEAIKNRIGQLYGMASGFNKLTGKDNPTEHFARMRSYVLSPRLLLKDMEAVRAMQTKKGGSALGRGASPSADLDSLVNEDGTE